MTQQQQPHLGLDQQNPWANFQQPQGQPAHAGDDQLRQQQVENTEGVQVNTPPAGAGAQEIEEQKRRMSEGENDERRSGEDVEKQKRGSDSHAAGERIGKFRSASKDPSLVEKARQHGEEAANLIAEQHGK